MIDAGGVSQEVSFLRVKNIQKVCSIIVVKRIFLLTSPAKHHIIQYDCKMRGLMKGRVSNVMKEIRMWRFIFLSSILLCFLTPLVQAKTHLELANEYAGKSEEFFNEGRSCFSG